MRCNICGSETSSKNIIRDLRFSIKNGEAQACTSCFEDWASGRDESLYNKIAEKLKEGK